MTLPIDSENPVIKAKRTIRALMVELRRFSHNPSAAQALIQWADRLDVRPGQVVAGYWPMGDEMDIRPLLDHFAARGIALCLPVVVGDDQPLKFRLYQSGDDLEDGPLRTRQPKGDKPELLPDLVLVPLLAWDRNLMRLGYGRGFYDRTLSALRAQKPVRAIGVAYHIQEVEEVPTQAHDQPLDGILTEQEFLP